MELLPPTPKLADLHVPSALHGACFLVGVWERPVDSKKKKRVSLVCANTRRRRVRGARPANTFTCSHSCKHSPRYTSMRERVDAWMCTHTQNTTGSGLSQKTEWGIGGDVYAFRSLPSMQLIGQGASEVCKDRAEPLTPPGQALVLSPGNGQADKAILGLEEVCRLRGQVCTPPHSPSTVPAHLTLGNTHFSGNFPRKSLLMLTTSSNPAAVFCS